MISAPNHLRLLSGNKISILLLPFLLLSCGAFKKTQPIEWPDDDEVVVISPKDDDHTPVKEDPTKNVKEESKTIYSLVNFKGEEYKVPVHKNVFDIAVLLPFHSDASNNSIDKRRRNVMLEYYQGMKLAFSDIENINSKFNIHFYDTDNDTAKLRKILSKQELENMDLIIGPTGEAQVKIAAYFARKRKIPLFSPMTTVSTLWSNNPYVFNLNPSPEMQAKRFLDYFNQYHSGEKLLIVRDGKRYDKTFGAALVALCDSSAINYSKIAYSRYLKWENYLGPKNTVIVNTVTDKTSVAYSVTSLLSHPEGITLVGSDKWMGFSSIDYGQWEKLNITFLSTSKSYNANVSGKGIQERYRLLYADDPSEYTYLGYDQLLFSCEVLNAFGSYFPLFVEGRAISYTNSDISLFKTKNCFQNYFLQIYKLKDREIEAVIIK